MPLTKPALFSSALVREWLITIGFVAVVASLPAYFCAGLWYSETKGPFKNLTQVVDLDEDGDLDIVISHTRWEAVDLSWPGVGLWINQGRGKFEHVDVQNTDGIPKYEAGAGTWTGTGMRICSSRVLGSGCWRTRVGRKEGRPESSSRAASG